MKIYELIDQLQNFDLNMEVILQKDAEGNGYSPLSGAEEVVYVADATWSGDAYSLDWSADDADMEEDEWDEILSRPHSVVLFPVN